MRVKVTATVEIDPDLWASEYGIERAEVREDVKNYYANILARLADEFNNSGGHQL